MKMEANNVVYNHRLGKGMMLLSILVTLVSITSCTEDSIHPGTQIEGLWGARHIILVADKAGAVLEYDCAHGTIDEPLIPDSDGHFDLVGTHTWESGGPIRQDQQDTTHPARYQGSISGNKLTLTIRLTDGDEVLGPYVLVQDDPGRVYKCL